MLHVTNGQATVRGLREGAIPGVYLAWEDPLHDGPVPPAASLAELSSIRSKALSSFGWGVADEIHASFVERDATLARFSEHDEVVLWFEHDLYDQLQLIQLLDWFAGQDLSGTALTLIQIGEHPDLETFHGLGELRGEQLAALLPTRTPVTAEHFATGRQAWSALRAPEPSGLLELIREKAVSGDKALLPFLVPALERLVQEYPSVANGLSRLEQHLLVAGALGARRREAFYLQSQEFEPCPWGDSSVYLRLDGLASGARPALDRIEGGFVINERGRAVLASEDDWVSGSGIDRWIGGVHLVGARAQWRWSDEQRTVLTDAVS